MNRRNIIALLGGAAAWPVTARAQDSTIPVIGYLGNYGTGAVPDTTNERSLSAFRKGLMETGYEEGRNVRMEYRWIAGQNGQLPSLLRELIDRRVTVLAPVASRRQRSQPRQRPKPFQLCSGSGAIRLPPG
jgi:putative ABC transport system substrate-binding protein